MDTKQIIKLYTVDEWTLRMIAEKFDTNHHRIKRLLVKNGVVITRRKTKKEFTEEHRKKIGLASKGRQATLGKKMPKSSLYKNMKNHLAYDVSLEWLESFDDVEKLKFLNRSISRPRDKVGFTTEIYKRFVEKFYQDKQFNKLYSRWIETGDKWAKPSLDHIGAKSKGCDLADIDNLQFLTWFENRAKVDMSQEEWDKIKQNINYYLL